MKNKLLLGLLIASGNVLAAPLEGSVNTILHYNKIEHMGVKVDTSSNHYASVTNNTDKIETITASYNLCINGICAKQNPLKIRVNPHATWTDQKTLNFNPYLTYPGLFAITSQTKITGNYGLNLLDWKHGEIEVRR